jgi:hypothetical protein
MSKLFRPTLIRQDESSSGNYLINTYLQDQKYSDRFIETNLESTSSFRYGDKPYLVSTQQLEIDWSKFENHTFFHSAVANVNEAFDKIVNFYPFDKNEKEVEQFEDEMTGFEKYVLESFPKNVGYLNFIGGNENHIKIVDKRGVNVQGISEVADAESVLDPVGSPFSIEFFIKLPEQANGKQIIFQKLNNEDEHISIGLDNDSSTEECNMRFTIRFGNDLTTTGSLKKGVWNHCSCYYYAGQQVDSAVETPLKSYMLINDTLSESPGQVSFANRLSFPLQDLFIGKGSSFAYRNASGNKTFFIPGETFSGSIDNLKFYHRNNLSEKIKKNKYFQAYPNVGDDSLKLFLKFNEPSGTYTGNDLVLDSSGNALHSRIENFTTDCRLTGSDNPVTAETISRNPVLFPEFSTVDSLNQSLLITASLYDDFNPNLITKLVPQHYFQDATIFKDFNEEFDDLGGFFKNISNNKVGKNSSDLPSMQLLIKMLLAYAKYFDEIKIMIDSITNFAYTEYDEYDTTPDVFLLEKAKLTNTILPQFMSYGSVDQLIKGVNLSNTKTESTRSLVKIQNLVWRRILSEAGKFKQRKGTVESIKGMFRNAGIEPDNILDFREYGGAKIKSLDASKETKKDIIYFLNFTGSIGKKASTLNSLGYPATGEEIPHIKSGFLSGSRNQHGKPEIRGTFVDKTPQNPNGVSNRSDDGLFTSGSFTYEGLYTWPKGYQSITESLCRLHITGTLAPSSTESCIFNLVASDEKIQLYFREHTSTDTAVKSLVLTGANIFDKDIWHVSFGKQDIHEFDTSLSSSYFIRASKQENGELLKYCQTSSFYREGSDSTLKVKSTVNTSGSFIVIGSQSFQNNSNFLNNNTSQDALFTDFTGFVTNLRFFSKYINDREWLGHAKSYTSYGVDNPKINYNYSLLETGSFERLILHTEPKQSTKTSDSNGSIRLFDFSKNNLHLEGKNFDALTQVLKPERVNYEVLSDKFDINYTKDKIRIRSFQDSENKEQGYYSEFAPLHEIITSEESIDDNRLSLDMSVMRGINRNVLNSFSDLHVLENVLGQPNLMYLEFYPELEDIRNVYFENFLEKINLEKYRSLFKWVDNSFTEIVYSIVPRTTNFLGINFIYESHVLERNRYRYLHDRIYKHTRQREFPEGDFFESTSIGPLVESTNNDEHYANSSSQESGERTDGLQSLVDPNSFTGILT